MAIVIPCGSKKLRTSKPVPARELYIGSLFRLCLSTAVTLDANIFILSAGYGLISVDDFVLPYNIVMSHALINQHRDAIAQLNWDWENDVRLLLPEMYRLAMPAECVSLIRAGAPQSEFSAIVKKLRRHKVLAVWGTGKLCDLKVFRTQQNFRRARVVDPCTGLGICATIHKLAYELDSKELINHRLISIFGKPLGGSYIPTITTQTRKIGHFVPRRK